MHVVLKDGSRCIVMLNSIEGDLCVDMDKKEIFLLGDVEQDLTYPDDSYLDIDKVIEPNLMAHCLYKEGRLLWERKEEKPILTLDGVEYSESTLRSLIKKATHDC